MKLSTKVAVIVSKVVELDKQIHKIMRTHYWATKIKAIGSLFARVVITHCCLRQHRFGVRPQNKGHKVKDGALRTALSPIAICGRAALLPIGVGATMPTQPRRCYEGDGAAKVDHHSIVKREHLFIHRISLLFI